MNQEQIESYIKAIDQTLAKQECARVALIAERNQMRKLLAKVKKI